MLKFYVRNKIFQKKSICSDRGSHVLRSPEPDPPQRPQDGEHLPYKVI